MDNVFALKGKQVKVVRGRKVPLGTTGECFWIGRDTYASKYGRTAYRIGIKDTAGNTHWTAASNVEVVEASVPVPTAARAPWETPATEFTGIAPYEVLADTSAEW